MDKQQYMSVVDEKPTANVENKSLPLCQTTPGHSQSTMSYIHGEGVSSHQQMQTTMGGSSTFYPPQASGYISYPNYTTVHYPSGSFRFQSPSNQSPAMYINIISFTYNLGKPFQESECITKRQWIFLI